MVEFTSLLNGSGFVHLRIGWMVFIKQLRVNVLNGSQNVQTSLLRIIGKLIKTCRANNFEINKLDLQLINRSFWLTFLQLWERRSVAYVRHRINDLFLEASNVLRHWHTKSEVAVETQWHSENNTSQYSSVASQRIANDRYSNLLYCLNPRLLEA